MLAQGSGFVSFTYRCVGAGIGCAQLVVSGLVAIYYNMIIAYSLFYFFASLAKTLPWKHCDHYWNTDGKVHVICVLPWKNFVSDEPPGHQKGSFA